MATIRRIQEDVFGLYAEIDLSLLLPKIAEKVKHFLECEEASIFVYNPIKKELSFETATGKKGKSLKEITVKTGEGIAGWIAQNRKPLVINDCAADPRFAGRFDRQVQFNTRSIVGVPVTMGGAILGVIEAINKKKGKFTSRHEEILNGMARFVAIPLQNAILFRKILRETREKEQLLMLGKKISAALSTGEIFSSLKQIILDILEPSAIRIFIRPENQIYELITNTVTDADALLAEETQVLPTFLRFPLHTGRGSFGYLEIENQSHLDEVSVSLVRGLAAYVAITSEKFLLYRQMVEKEKVTRELQIAREIQQSFLAPPGLEVPGMDLAYLNLPSSAVGGDYYEILPLTSGRLIISIHDVSGHGIPASLLMSIFRTHFIHHMKKNPDLVKTLSLANELIAETMQANLYVTSFAAMIDREAMRLSYVNAGHPSPLLIRRGESSELPSNSLVIGLMADAVFQTTDIPLELGDLLVLYTDGAIEAENDQGEPFGMDRLVSFCHERSQAPAAEIRDQLIAEIQRFSGSDRFSDDVTLLIARVLP